MKPEYLHAVSNHVLVIGVGLGIFALILALYLRSRQAQIVALAVILLSSAAAYPVLFLGQQAYKSVRGMADEPGQGWLDTHMERAETTIYIRPSDETRCDGKHERHGPQRHADARQATKQRRHEGHAAYGWNAWDGRSRAPR